MYLTKIEEEQTNLVDHITEHRARVKIIFDKRARTQNFMEGDKVLLWDKRRELCEAHGKFEILCNGPFEISQALGSNTFRLRYKKPLM